MSFFPQETWYFVFALVFVLTGFLALDWKKKKKKKKKTVSRSLPCRLLRVFTEKNPCYNNAIKLCMDDTLVEEDVSVIFDELEVQNPPL